MSHEATPVPTSQIAERSVHTRILSALEQHRRDLAISFAATILAGLALLTNPSATNPETQTNIIPVSDSNYVTIYWSPDSKNTDPVKLVVSFAMVGLLGAFIAKDIVNEDENDKK